ncbi:PPOX class F420-dependent oxidoreductase [Nocardioides sp. BGMRC 2183]|jgi:PPOX class probable F420-dependent enzyme|nr:PPOX class F420-dependent oxidoreductase [Nocardioides sp. BGMRC 2183]
MAYHAMSDAEVRRFLSADPARPAVLATVRKDGRPHAAPIWYVLEEDGAILFNTGAETVKGRNLARTGLATLTVQEDRAPFSFVTVEGTVTTSDDLEEVRTAAARIGGRYMGAARSEEYGERNGVPGELVVRLTPTKVISAADVAD